MPATANVAMRSLFGLAVVIATCCGQRICADETGADPRLLAAPQAMANGNSHSVVGTENPTTPTHAYPPFDPVAERPPRPSNWRQGLTSDGDGTRGTPAGPGLGGGYETQANRTSEGAKISPPERKPAIPLPAKGDSPETAADGATGPVSSIVKMAASLAVALGLFLVVAWLMRRAAPRGSQTLPDEVVEMLGRSPLAGRQQVQLLRVGRKLVLVAVAQGKAETLTEITDPEEVDRLAGLCRKSHPHSASEAFRQVFRQFAGQRAGSGAREGRDA